MAKFPIPQEALLVGSFFLQLEEVFFSDETVIALAKKVRAVGEQEGVQMILSYTNSCFELLREKWRLRRGIGADGAERMMNLLDFLEVDYPQPSGEVMQLMARLKEGCIG